MLIVAIYVGVILLFIRTIILAKLARHEMLENDTAISEQNVTSLPPHIPGSRRPSQIPGSRRPSYIRADRIYDL